MSRFALTIAALAAAPIALAACAASPAEVQRMADRDDRQRAELDKRLAGFTPGRPVTCIPTVRMRSTRLYGGTILYEASSNLIYRNDTNAICGNGFDDILVTQTPTPQLCAGDIVRTVDRTARVETGGCGLGEFVPYRRGARPD
ncbi:hypothetical protein [Sphingomonas sp.]|jgi:hypothetical protein